MSIKGILGRKVGMTQLFDEEGKVVPVTVLAVEPNVVTQVRTVETDGYSAAQVAFGECRVDRLTRPEQGVLLEFNLAATCASLQSKRMQLCRLVM